MITISLDNIFVLATIVRNSLYSLVHIANFCRYLRRVKGTVIINWSGLMPSLFEGSKYVEGCP